MKNMKNEVKVKEDRIFCKEIQIKILYVINNNHYRENGGGGEVFITYKERSEKWLIDILKNI